MATKPIGLARQGNPPCRAFFVEPDHRFRPPRMWAIIQRTTKANLVMQTRLARR